MRSGGSKDKGNKWEIQVYDDLRSLKVPVWSARGSGSREDEKGDIYTENYLMECKHYKKLTQGMINTFWKKIVVEARDMGKNPVLLYKENFVRAKALFLSTTPLNDSSKVFKITMDYQDFLTYLELVENKERLE